MSTGWGDEFIEEKLVSVLYGLTKKEKKKKSLGFRRLPDSMRFQCLAAWRITHRASVFSSLSLWGMVSRNYGCGVRYGFLVSLVFFFFVFCFIGSTYFEGWQTYVRKRLISD